MRVVLQRVTEARVAVDGEVIGEIGTGFVALVGIADGDDEDAVDAMARDIAGLRVFADHDGRMNLSVEEVHGSILVVSQFTLIADTAKGRRPSFAGAARPEVAEPLVNRLTDDLSSRGIPVETGRFGAAMNVLLANDGPVTIVLDR